MPKNLAVIGSGIAGLVSANLLSQNNVVTLFETNNYIGGHTHTVDIVSQGKQYALDTGFIVFNQKTYPLFCKLLTRLGVNSQLSEMSFSYRSDTLGLEYNGNRLNSLFADRANLFKPSFYKMLLEIIRFNRSAKDYLSQGIDTLSINEFLEKHSYSKWFIQAYFLPMAAAIWSVNPADIKTTSARFIFNFFANHGLLDITNRPQWYVIEGGSRNYIAPLIQPFQNNIRLNSSVQNIWRRSDHVILRVEDKDLLFDGVVIATHSDQALALLADATPAETEILQAINYKENDVVLHTDTSLLPQKRLAWASWNYLDTPSGEGGLTYYMNRLQGIVAPTDFCVSVNLTERIRPDKILQKFRYSHPNFTQSAIQAQQRYSEINGKRNTYYCGAYWGYGFHEDGVKSALDACAALGVAW